MMGWPMFRAAERNKFKATKTIIDGETFDSNAEGRRWLQLRAMEQNGEIKSLKRQVRFRLLPAQRDEETKHVIEQRADYIADFTYNITKTGEYVVEDVKGMRTPDYILKRKMMLYFYGYKIHEVDAKDV